MTTIAGIGFSAPWLLLALLALPVIWILLRAVPPAPLRAVFPAVTLLLGLDDKDSTADRTPWWLLVLRCLTVALLILAFSGPVLNPDRNAQSGTRILILADASWASAADWDERTARIERALDRAESNGQLVKIVALSAVKPGQELPGFASAIVWRENLPNIRPAAWAPSEEQMQALADSLPDETTTLWLSDGLARTGRAAFYRALSTRGPVRIVQSDKSVTAMMPARFDEGEVVLSARRSISGVEQVLGLRVIGPGPSGLQRSLASGRITFGMDDTDAETRLELPAEMRNRVERIVLDDIASAGAVALVGDGLRRREVAILGNRADREGLRLLSGKHYLNSALAPSVDLMSGAFADVLPANPDVIILDDVAKIAPGEAKDIEAWVERGGLLIRFAGPQMAATTMNVGQDDTLLPVRLRAGGRSIGGAMSWGEPRKLAPFKADTPFYGLPLPQDIQVRAQVLAQPGPDLSARTLASLADGTPLITRKYLGAGQIVLFHVTANAEWSNLPLSGLFVSMLERLSVAGRSQNADSRITNEGPWRAQALLDGFGTVMAEPPLPIVDGAKLAGTPPGPENPPGIYANEGRFYAHNVLTAESRITPVAWPLSAQISPLVAAPVRSLKGPLLVAALVLLMLDALVSMALAGRITRIRPQPATQALVLAISLGLTIASAPADGRAQAADELALAATSQTVLAHVLTGNPDVDRIARAGLIGLSDTLFARTSIEPADPIGIDLERDELALFPMLYWPVTPDQTLPSATAYARLNAYLRSGGLILFDTRDAGRNALGAGSTNGAKLQALALPLEIPPLEPVPKDHVLTRSFYLMQSFPGRFDTPIWVEAAPPGAVQAEGMPFRNLNDNVTPVVIGGNDWAAAWAVDESGRWLLPVGRGAAGERQREFALRFGVNLIMHVLTGNYKSDQVHVPALLDRLGQ